MFDRPGTASPSTATAATALSVRTPRQPRYPLQRKLVLLTVALVIVPTLVCALWLTQLTHAVMVRGRADNLRLLAQTTSAALSDKLLDGWSAEASMMLDSLNNDPRLAFAVVSDKHRNVMHRRVIDLPSYAAFDRSPARDRPLNEPLALGQHGDVLVYSAPIWDRPARYQAGTARPADDAPRQLLGFLVLGLHEHDLPDALARVGAMQWLAAAAVCALSVPLVIWGVRKWTLPLRQLLNATNHLEMGIEPPPVEVTSRDELGQLTEAFNGMAHRLTAARREMEDANAQLERNVAQRTAELQQVNQRLQNEMRDKDQFIRAISHDMGAPLRNIAGMTGMLLMKYRAQLADDALNKLERIAANVKVQVDMIDELMELSRIRCRAGKRQRVDLRQLLGQITDSLSYDLEKLGVELVIPDDLPHLTVEPNRIRQVFQNLLDNAAKYMRDAAEKRITVGCIVEPDRYHFSVADTGPGIPLADLPGLFQVFHRGSIERTSDIPGRGVGLAGVKAIVESHGGSIWADSTPGRGAVFHFTLDRRIVDAAPDTGAATAPSAGAEASPSEPASA